jgi:hypothetical protein
MRCVAMRSISAGGQPWSVDSVTERETHGEMESTNAASTCWKRSRLALAHAMASWKTGVLEASFMLLM